MLKFSDAATLALHAIFIIAAESGRPLSAASLAQYLDVSEAHLSKVLQRLAKLDLIESRRGPHGGFSLGKHPEAITLLDVYEAIDGPVRQNTCLLGREDCPMHGCIMGGLVASLSNQLRAFLSQTSLATLMREPGVFIPERTSQGDDAQLSSPLEGLAADEVQPSRAKRKARRAKGDTGKAS
ncbi:MAG: Rrf2 family transcriptional regulator [Myxococcota bacterium]|jgi:Rrf2 family protein|nr:Rrf2 family transcriptional regulator [Myxococcota bacterium]